MITIIQGPSGSGKSTLGKSIASETGAVLRDEAEIGCLNGFDYGEDVVFVLTSKSRITFIDLYEKENN